MLAIYKTFPHSITSLSMSWSLTYFFQITNFHCIYYSARGRDEHILLLFLTIFIFPSGNSFILPYYAQYFT